VFLELHCHTVFSPDAYCTPEEVVDVAAERNISTIAITDHNHLGANERGAKRAKERGIQYLSGIEWDATWKGRNFHFLAFGFDAEHAGLKKIASEKRAQYKKKFDLYAEKFPAFGLTFDETEMKASLLERYRTNPSPTLNLYAARDFFLNKGAVKNLEEWKKIQTEIKKQLKVDGGLDRLESSGPFEEVRDGVRQAGGVILLAHVAEYFPGEIEKQVAIIRELLNAGMDGFEVYHPDNFGDACFQQLLAFAEGEGCLLSGGSDCHNALSSQLTNPIGISKTPASLLPKIESAIKVRHKGV
jgi:3',5'-nucleoside bisphosphate phosphatase